MSKELLDAYVAAWSKHTKAGDSPEGQANLKEFLALLSDDVTYEDVPTGHAFTGHQGVSEMCALVSNAYDVEITVLAAQTNGSRFAIEFASKLKMRDTGQEVANQGVAVGTIVNGKIASHRDLHVVPGSLSLG